MTTPPSKTFWIHRVATTAWVKSRKATAGRWRRRRRACLSNEKRNPRNLPRRRRRDKDRLSLFLPHDLLLQTVRPFAPAPTFTDAQTPLAEPSYVTYVMQPMCRLIGNKRALIDFIEDTVWHVRGLCDSHKLGTLPSKITILDAFAGSTVVSRMLAAHATKLYSNDFENYAHIFGQCYLEHPEKKGVSLEHVKALALAANAAADDSVLEMKKQLGEGKKQVKMGIMATHYAPADSESIKEGERCFFTHENAVRIDAIRHFIAEKCSEAETPYLLAPLLVQCSIRANTTGVFNAFMKKDGIGCWGGRTETSGDRRRIIDALVIPEVEFNPHKGCDVKCFKEDANKLIPNKIHISEPELDLIYVDSPYNQHSYGSNYGVLNIVADNRMPKKVTANSGIPVDWQRSAYYKKNEAAIAMKDLLKKATVKAKYVLISFSDEGHIDSDGWDEILQPYWSEVFQKDHRSTMGTRNYEKRGKSTVVEVLYLVWAKNKGLPGPRHAGECLAPC